MSCFYEFAHYHIAHKKPFTGESYVAVGGFEKVFAYAFPCINQCIFAILLWLIVKIQAFSCAQCRSDEVVIVRVCVNDFRF